jgi:hypothetical protein
MTVSGTMAERYRYWRNHGLTANHALGYAKYERDMRVMLDRFDSWTFDGIGPYGAFACADLKDAPEGYTIRVLVGDDDMPVDWGDCEPTDEEREHATAYYVAVQVLEGNEEVYHDGIGGVDVIDLPGYLQRDWEDAAAYALIEYLYGDALRFAQNETAERDHWAARDTITVDR